MTASNGEMKRTQYAAVCVVASYKFLLLSVAVP